jgi:hypothetical protein
MSLSLFRLKLIVLLRAGHINPQEYQLFANLARTAQPLARPPMEYVEEDSTAPVFQFFEQQAQRRTEASG